MQLNLVCRPSWIFISSFDTPNWYFLLDWITCSYLLILASLNTFSFSADATCLPQISWKTPVKHEPMGWDLGLGGREKGGGGEGEKSGKKTG